MYEKGETISELYLYLYNDNNCSYYIEINEKKRGNLNPIAEEWIYRLSEIYISWWRYKENMDLDICDKKPIPVNKDVLEVQIAVDYSVGM